MFLCEHCSLLEKSWNCPETFQPVPSFETSLFISEAFVMLYTPCLFSMFHFIV